MDIAVLMLGATAAVGIIRRLMDFPLARQRFYQEVQQPDAAINVAAAALYIAQEEYPELEVDVYLNALDVMAEEARDLLPKEPYPLKILRALNHYFFEDLGFRGNTRDYYDLRNSYLNDVLERRIGIPITLALIYLEVANRIDFPMVGVGMPGHFLIRPTIEDMDIYIDPFHRGEIMFEQDCQDRLQQIYGNMAQLRPHDHLKAVSPKAALARMLGNLKLIHLHYRDVPKALAAIDRILLMFPKAPSELRDRGLLYYQQGQLAEALQDLELYLLERPDAQDAYEIRHVIEQIERVKD